MGTFQDGVLKACVRKRWGREEKEIHGGGMKI